MESFDNIIKTVLNGLLNRNPPHVQPHRLPPESATKRGTQTPRSRDANSYAEWQAYAAEQGSETPWDMSKFIAETTPK